MWVSAIQRARSSSTSSSISSSSRASSSFIDSESVLYEEHAIRRGLSRSRLRCPLRIRLTGKTKQYLVLIAFSAFLSFLFLTNHHSGRLHKNHKQDLRRLSRWRWKLQFPPWKPIKLAIYAGKDADWGQFGALIYTLTSEPLAHVTTSSAFVEDIGEVKAIDFDRDILSTFWKPAFYNPQALLKPASTFDVLFVVPSRFDGPLIRQLVHTTKRTKLVFIVADVPAFQAQVEEQNLLAPLSEASKSGRVFFMGSNTQLLESVQAIFHGHVKTTATIQAVQLSAHTKTFTPCFPVPRAEIPRTSTSHRPFGTFGVIVRSTAARDVEYVNNLISEFQDALKTSPTTWGYSSKNKDGVSKLVPKRKKAATLHVVMPPCLSPDGKEKIRNQIVIPKGIEKRIEFHAEDNAASIYRAISNLHVLLPSTYDPSLTAVLHHEPAWALALSTRVPLLLLRSAASQLSNARRPAVISLPDLANSTAVWEKPLPLFKAIAVLRNGSDPRRRMAAMSRPWDSLNSETHWTAIIDDVVAQNQMSVASVLGL